MLLAAVLTAVGYAALFAYNQASIPTKARPELTPPEVDPPVDGLPPIKPLGGWVEAALTPERGARASGSVSVAIHGSADTAAAGGVGVLDGRSFAVLWWADLAGRELPSTESLPGLPVGDHWLVTAWSRGVARFSYSSRSELRIRDDSDPEREAATVDASVRALHLTLVWPAPEQPMPPYVHATIRRSDDATWLYRSPDSAYEQHDEGAFGQTDRRDFVFLGLGPGSYRLELEIGDAEVVPEDVGLLTFTLPGPDRLTVHCRMRSPAPVRRR